MHLSKLIIELGQFTMVSWQWRQMGSLSLLLVLLILYSATVDGVISAGIIDRGVIFRTTFQFDVATLVVVRAGRATHA